jgi:hypothetical protein
MHMEWYTNKSYTIKWNDTIKNSKCKHVNGLIHNGIIYSKLNGAIILAKSPGKQPILDHKKITMHTAAKQQESEWVFLHQKVFESCETLQVDTIVCK